MSHSGCRSSGLLTNTHRNGVSSAEPHLVHTGRCKLISIHAANLHATVPGFLTVYDNTAASGKIVGKMILPPYTAASNSDTTALSVEFDMHGVICHNGLMVDLTNGTIECTIEYA